VLSPLRKCSVFAGINIPLLLDREVTAKLAHQIPVFVLRTRHNNVFQMLLPWLLLQKSFEMRPLVITIHSPFSFN